VVCCSTANAKTFAVAGNLRGSACEYDAVLAALSADCAAIACTKTTDAATPISEGATRCVSAAFAEEKPVTIASKKRKVRVIIDLLCAYIGNGDSFVYPESENATYTGYFAGALIGNSVTFVT
jgi:hypothetical protein